MSSNVCDLCKLLINLCMRALKITSTLVFFFKKIKGIFLPIPSSCFQKYSNKYLEDFLLEKKKERNVCCVSCESELSVCPLSTQCLYAEWRVGLPFSGLLFCTITDLLFLLQAAHIALLCHYNLHHCCTQNKSMNKVLCFILKCGWTLFYFF